MKKQLLLAAFGCAAFASTAQTVTDTVIMGSGYANQIWYSLPHDEMATQPKNNWDLAFRTSGSMGSSIMVNHSGGGTIWVYPNAAIAGWKTVDTTGLSTWTPQYNMETEWTGALGRYANPSDAFDLGWGIYDMGTHYVTGDSIYIVKTQTGAYKKLIIDRLASSTYTFTYANLDGSDSTTSSLSKGTYSDKNFGYFNLDTKTVIDREPATTDWDLVFGQYATGDYTSMGIDGYTVTGVLVNDTISVAKAIVDPVIRNTYNSYASLTFGNKINGMGYTWKSTSGAIKDSNVYFVRRNNGDIWKINFTGWISGVSGNGSAIFTKEQLSGTSIVTTSKTNTTLALSPNPARNGENVSIVYHFDQNVKSAIAQVYDITGRMVLSLQLDNTHGIHAYTFNNNFSAGTYIVSIIADNEMKQQKLLVQ